MQPRAIRYKSPHPKNEDFIFCVTNYSVYKNVVVSYNQLLAYSICMDQSYMVFAILANTKNNTNPGSPIQVLRISTFTFPPTCQL